MKSRINKKEGFIQGINEGGRNISFSDCAEPIEQDGWLFRDMNHNGTLEPYEDWRLSAEERVEDLVSRMDTDDKLGVMLHSGMFMAVKITEEMLDKNPKLKGRLHLVNGFTLEDAMALPAEAVPEGEKDLIIKEKMRFWLLSMVEDGPTAARYVNNLQKVAEDGPYGIPMFVSTNPRSSKDEHNDAAGAKISYWPSNLGIGATFDPEIAGEFGRIASREYRAMGITVDLGPQTDPATDPRWSRFAGTYGESPRLNADIARALIDGMQTSEGEKEIEAGWGYDSVMTMPKHWPGSTGEGGRESHDERGKYSVYPGNNFEGRLVPWTEGAFKLNGSTKEAASVMTCYDAIWDQDREDGQNVGASFIHHIIDGILRDRCGWAGFVCTDFGVTGTNKGTGWGSKAWGFEDQSPAENALKEIEAGIDQFGGLDELEVVKEAYELACEKHGKDWTDARIDMSVKRILINGFRMGLFDDPYTDPEEAVSLVGRDDYVRKGYEAILKSMVLLKNKDVLPLNGKSVYVPERRFGGQRGFDGKKSPVTMGPPFSDETAERYFTAAGSPDDADCAVVFMDSPASGNGTDPDTGEIVPISLQYEDYTAEYAREQSIASDPKDGKNRSYRGKTVTTDNALDLEILKKVRSQMGDRPVIAVINCTKPFVPAEVEPLADAILITFNGTPSEAVLDLLTGKAEPSGLLPFQMPADMKTVEEQFEDVPHDMRPYKDGCGNEYDFAFGMNWSGVIKDERTKKYGSR